MVHGSSRVVIQSTITFDSLAELDAFSSWVGFQHGKGKDTPQVVGQFLDASDMARDQATQFDHNARGEAV